MTDPRRFHAALAHITEVFRPEVAARALGAWHLICAKTDPPEPMIGGEDDVLVTFAWGIEERYLDLHVRADNFEWFYRDRKTGTCAGSGHRSRTGPGSTY